MYIREEISNQDAIHDEIPLEDVFYEDDTTYRHIIEEVQTTLRRIIEGYKDTPTKVKLKDHPVSGIKIRMIRLNDLDHVNDPVQDGDVIYAMPLVDDDTIATALRDSKVAKLLHKEMEMVQNQRQRKIGGNS